MTVHDKTGITVDPTSDNALMEQVRDGQVARLAILFERHHVVLYNFFLRLTGRRGPSEDLVQEVFVRILKYQGGTPGARAGFTVWLFQIARNAHVDHLRRQKPEDPHRGAVRGAGRGPSRRPPRGWRPRSMPPC